MTTHVISHRKPRRKRRGSWWSFVLRRFGALAVTVAALATATWLAPHFYHRGPAPKQVEAVPPSGPALSSAPPSPSALTNDAASAAAEPQRQRRVRRGVPLDARADSAGEDFEVLSAGELDAISQARN